MHRQEPKPSLVVVEKDGVPFIALKQRISYCDPGLKGFENMLFKAKVFEAEPLVYVFGTKILNPSLISQHMLCKFSFFDDKDAQSAQLSPEMKALGEKAKSVPERLFYTTISVKTIHTPLELFLVSPKVLKMKELESKFDYILFKKGWSTERRDIGYDLNFKDSLETYVKSKLPANFSIKAEDVFKQPQDGMGNITLQLENDDLKKRLKKLQADNEAISKALEAQVSKNRDNQTMKDQLDLQLKKEHINAQKAKSKEIELHNDVLAYKELVNRVKENLETETRAKDSALKELASFKKNLITEKDNDIKYLRKQIIEMQESQKQVSETLIEVKLMTKQKEQESEKKMEAYKRIFQEMQDVIDFLLSRPSQPRQSCQALEVIEQRHKNWKVKKQMKDSMQFFLELEKAVEKMPNLIDRPALEVTSELLNSLTQKTNFPHYSLGESESQDWDDEAFEKAISK